MRAPRIAIATSQEQSALPPGERRLVGALAARGARGEPAVWSDEGVDWNAFDLVLIRSCWDSHLRAAEFLAWLARLEAAGVRVENPPALVRWNLRKSYLLALATRGVPVPPTLVPGSLAEAQEWLAARDWPEIVIKPLVSATAHETWRAALPLDAAARERLARAIGSSSVEAADAAPASVLRGVLVQPYLAAIARAGEHSFVFLDGTYSHAVLKRAKAGDFRVQEEHGGTVEAASPSETAIATATRAFAAAWADGARGPHLYGRVDALIADGAFHVMEVELVEPELFLSWREDAADVLAAALLRRLG
jgi:glutathione synthase/RimK-type ligase-like ATP-grasp enzyme